MFKGAPLTASLGLDNGSVISIARTEELMLFLC